MLDDPLVRAVAMWLVELAGGPIALVMPWGDEIGYVFAAPFVETTT